MDAFADYIVAPGGGGEQLRDAKGGLAGSALADQSGQETTGEHAAEQPLARRDRVDMKTHIDRVDQLRGGRRRPLDRVAEILLAQDIAAVVAPDAIDFAGKDLVLILNRLASSGSN